MAVASPSSHSRVSHPPKIPSADFSSRPDLWAELAEALLLSDASQPAVQRELEWYRGQRKFLRETATRAVPYLHFILTELRRQNLPADIVLLPILESGYDPQVTSPYGAAGLWQFMGGTGAKLGLHTDQWKDDRLDIVVSTRVALNYLTTLQQRFNGDWLMAIAAYNAGWGNIQNLIARNRRAGKATDVWALDLRRETRRLVARFVALVEIFKNPRGFGLELATIPDTEFFTPVALQQPTDLHRLARRTRIDETLFHVLNPAFKAWHTGPYLPQTVLIPVADAAAAQTFAQNAEPAPLPQLIRTESASLTTASDKLRRYRVKGGDSLWAIARRFDLRVADLERLNQLSRQHALRVGQHLVIGSRSPDDSKRATEVATKALIVQRYRVRAGDSLWTISRQFRVTVKQLLAWNDLTDSHTLRPGQELLVSNPT